MSHETWTQGNDEDELRAVCSCGWSGPWQDRIRAAYDDQGEHYRTTTPAATARPVVAEKAEERGEGICRTCLAPIWNEGGTVGRRKRAEGWSDRIERGGDSLVCFKARGYRHVPLTGREACIYDHAYARGLAARPANTRQAEVGR